MSTRERHLPDFNSPPVVETVLGVTYAPLSGWRIPHYGWFWTELKSWYPRIDVQPPLQFEVERFGDDEKKLIPPSVELLSEPEVRCWFIEQSGVGLLQLQRDGFLHNWRKLQSLQPYPHYENIRPQFERDWQKFVLFLEQAGLSAPAVLQCEVTYVNHIERGTLWNNFSDLYSVFPALSLRGSQGFLPDADALSFATRFPLPAGKGRLRIAMNPATRHSDGKDIIDLRLTARGAPKTSSVADILEWFDLGREWIVRGFTDITSTKAHDYWKRTQ